MPWISSCQNYVGALNWPHFLSQIFEGIQLSRCANVSAKAFCVPHSKQHRSECWHQSSNVRQRTRNSEAQTPQVKWYSWKWDWTLPGTLEFSQLWYAFRCRHRCRTAMSKTELSLHATDSLDTREKRNGRHKEKDTTQTQNMWHALLLVEPHTSLLSTPPS